MAMTWAAFESALGGHLDSAGALDALITSCTVDVQAMLDRIGAGEAGRLPAEAVTAETETRLSKLAAALDVIDARLPVEVRKAGLSKSDREAELFAARRVLQRIFQLLLNGMESSRTA
jgi:hypothetical protein